MGAYRRLRWGPIDVCVERKMAAQMGGILQVKWRARGLDGGHTGIVLLDGSASNWGITDLFAEQTGSPDVGVHAQGPLEPAQEQEGLFLQRPPGSRLPWLLQAPSQEALRGRAAPGYFHPGQAVLGNPPK